MQGVSSGSKSINMEMRKVVLWGQIGRIVIGKIIVYIQRENFVNLSFQLVRIIFYFIEGKVYCYLFDKMKGSKNYQFRVKM